MRQISEVLDAMPLLSFSSLSFLFLSFFFVLFVVSFYFLSVPVDATPLLSNRVDVICHIGITSQRFGRRVDTMPLLSFSFLFSIFCPVSFLFLCPFRRFLLFLFFSFLMSLSKNQKPQRHAANRLFAAQFRRTPLYSCAFRCPSLYFSFSFSLLAFLRDCASTRDSTKKRVDA